MRDAIIVLPYCNFALAKIHHHCPNEGSGEAFRRKTERFAYPRKDTIMQRMTLESDNE